MAAVWLLVTAALVVWVRARLLAVPLDRDEGEYAYVAQQWLQGVPPFQSIYHVKLPGIHAAYALIERVLGETAPAIRTGLAVVNLATCAVVFALARRFFGLLAAALATSAFALLTLAQELDGFSANAEHFVLLPALAGLLALVHAPGARHERALTFAAGLGLGLAVVVKQQGLFFAGAGLLWAAHQARLARPPPRALLANLGLFALGGVLPYAFVCATFLRLGLFERFWWWTFYYPQRYVTNISWADGWNNFWNSFHPAGEAVGAFDAHGPLLALAATGAGWAVVRGPRGAGAFLVSLGVGSALAVAAGLHFFPHYYLLATPAVALGVGAAAHGLVAWRGPAPALLAVAIVLGFAIHAQRAYLFELDPVMVSRQSFGANPFPESIEIARELEARTRPDEPIAVLGSEPQLYFLAKRRAATGYVYTYEMMRDHPHARVFQQEMIAEIEAARPRYVVMVNLRASWQAARLLEPDPRIFEWAARYLGQHYRQVGVVDIRWPRQTLGHFCWETAERTCRVPPTIGGQAPLWIGIHERIDGPHS